MSTFQQEIRSGERFRFGRNWSRFLKTVDDDRIAIARQSLEDKLQTSSLAGSRLLDAGCGSGLFSLAARQLGARVHSIDFDPESVACARWLRDSHFPEDADWTIEAASVLDRDYLAALGTFDVVYSWGVLHHTGHMGQALDNMIPLVNVGGRLFISVYNDQGRISRRWARVKKFYCSLPAWLQPAFTVAWYGPRELRRMLLATVLLRPHKYFRSWEAYRKRRGMSRWHDYVDWLGGYPFEVARPEDIVQRYWPGGFVLERMKTVGGGLGCNEFVFRRIAETAVTEPAESGPVRLSA